MLNAEDAFSLFMALTLLLVLCSFLKILIYTNLKAWSNLSKDKAIAMKNKKWGDKNRTPERDLLSDAWFGGPLGLVAILLKRHKIRKPLFLLHYCSRCSVGVFISLPALLILVYFVLYYTGHLLKNFFQSWTFMLITHALVQLGGGRVIGVLRTSCSANHMTTTTVASHHLRIVSYGLACTANKYRSIDDHTERRITTITILNDRDCLWPITFR